MGPLTGCGITWWCWTSQWITGHSQRSPRYMSPAAKSLLSLWVSLMVSVSVVCPERRLTCTAPGNVPWQSCAGLQAAGTGLGQETAPAPLHRGPAAQRRPPMNTFFKSHLVSHMSERSITGCFAYVESTYTVLEQINLGNLTEALVENSFSIFFLFPGN